MYALKVENHHGKSGWIVEKVQKKENEVRSNDNLIEVSRSVFLNTEPGRPTTEEEAPRWTGSEVVVEQTGTNNPPEPSEAMREIVAYYASLNQDADDPTKAGRKQMSNFLSTYPPAQSALQSGDYDALTGSSGYFEIAVEDTNLPDFDSAMRSDLEEILQGKTSYL